MTINKLSDLLAPLKDSVSRKTLAAIIEILSLARGYSYLGENFTFDASKDLDKQVNDILIRLSDLLHEDYLKTVDTFTEEEDRPAVLLYSPWEEELADKHASRIKTLIEAYLAVSFTEKLDNAAIVGGVLAFLNNPNGWLSGHGSSEQFHFGKGTAINPIDSLTIILSVLLSKAWQTNILQGYRKQGTIIGYRVLRGSDFYCPQCDELCIGVHQLSEQVLPAHPHCMCYTEPVYAEE